MSTEYEQLVVAREWIKELKKEWGFDPNYKPMKTITWKEFDKLELPKEKWLIQHILPREGFVIIASPSGEKKTWVAMTMAMCIANGDDFLGNNDFKTQKSNVLYIDEEMPESELQRRGRLLGLSNTSGTIHLANRNDLNFNKEEAVKELEEFIKNEEIKVVFIDTLRSVAGGLNEDKAEDVRNFFDQFKAFKNQGVVIVFLDHCRKPSFHEGKLPKKEQVLGSQDKLASIETLLMIKSEERNEEIFFFQKKSRSGIEYPPFKIEMKDEVDERLETISIKLIYAGKLEEKEYVIDQARGFVMDILSNGGKRRQEILTILLKDYKVGSKNGSGAIRELEIVNKINKKKDGNKNFYEINKDWEDIGQKKSSLLDQF